MACLLCAPIEDQLGYCTVRKDDQGEYHWFNKWDSKVIDITEDQYYRKGRTPPYDTAVKKQQLGGRHGAKANRLLEKINR